MIVGFPGGCAPATCTLQLRAGSGAIYAVRVISLYPV